MYKQIRMPNEMFEYVVQLEVTDIFARQCMEKQAKKGIAPYNKTNVAWFSMIHQIYPQNVRCIDRWVIIARLHGQ